MRYNSPEQQNKGNDFSNVEKNLATLFQNRVYKNRHRLGIAYKTGSEWVSLTWEAVGERVEKIGRGLLALGVKPGDRVAIISGNRPEWVMADLAILSIGAVSVPIYPNATSDQAKFILTHCEAHVVFASGSEGEKILQPILTDLPNLQVVWFDGDNPDNLTSLETKGANISTEEFYRRIEKIEPTDLATLVYTSGTTGEPKGVMLTHKNIVSNAHASAEVFPIGKEDHFLSFLPLSHALERTAGFYTVLHVGAKISFAESLAKVGQNLQEVKPTIIVSVPRVLEKMYGKIQLQVSERARPIRFLFKKASTSSSRPVLALSEKLFFKKVREQLGGELRYIVCGGAAMNPEVGHFFRQIGFEILEGYGLTEAGPIVSVNPPQKNRLGTVGKPLPGVEIKIAADGEVLVRGPNVMMGYYKDAQATSNTMDADGFLKTGDIGILEADGYLRLTDRKKELIVTSGGKNIAPTLIENALKKNLLVDHVCIVGDGQKFIAALLVPHFRLLEKKASAAGIPVEDRNVLVVHPTVREWFQQIVNEANSKLAGYETVKKFTLLSTEFSIEQGEITPTLKLRRKVIHARYSEKIADLFK